MSVTVDTSIERKTLADLLDGLGGVSPVRVRLHPLPGMATEADLLDNNEHHKPLCELVDGVLLEKPLGYYESMLALILARHLGNYLDQHDLGILLGEAGPMRLAPGLVRLPDLSFLSWTHFPNRQLPHEPIPNLAPDLAVEILSASNTRAEMERKLREYFAAGTQLVWIVDPELRTIREYTGPEQFIARDESQELDGGALLPGFRLSIRQLFERAGRRPGQG